MLKEEFKQMVKNKDYQVEWFERYYQHKSGIRINPGLFRNWFDQLNLDEVLDHIAKEFGLDRLLSNAGVMIAVYEPIKKK